MLVLLSSLGSVHPGHEPKEGAVPGQPPMVLLQGDMCLGFRVIT